MISMLPHLNENLQEEHSRRTVSTDATEASVNLELALMT
jgi:hypothetical protein